MSIPECGKFIDLVNSNGACAMDYYGREEKYPFILLSWALLTAELRDTQMKAKQVIHLL